MAISLPKTDSTREWERFLQQMVQALEALETKADAVDVALDAVEAALVALEGAPPPALVKSIQRGTIAITNGNSSAAATITSVATAKSELRFLGADSAAAAQFAYLVLTNGTTVTATRAGTSGNLTVSFEVTEFF